MTKPKDQRQQGCAHITHRPRLQQLVPRPQHRCHHPSPSLPPHIRCSFIRHTTPGSALASHLSRHRGKFNLHFCAVTIQSALPYTLLSLLLEAVQDTSELLRNLLLPRLLGRGIQSTTGRRLTETERAQRKLNRAGDLHSISGADIDLPRLTDPRSCTHV